MIGAGEVVGGDRKYIHCTRISNSNEQEMTGITPRLGLHNLVLKPSNRCHTVLHSQLPSASGLPVENIFGYPGQGALHMAVMSLGRGARLRSRVKAALDRLV